MMKKKIIITFLVMSMAVVANAALTVVIQDETGAWREYPDSTFTITPSTNIVWGIMDDGQGHRRAVCNGCGRDPAVYLNLPLSQAV